MDENTMKLVLTVEQASKGIPYPAELENDRTNYGFKDLKGDLEAIDAIAEVQDCPALRDSLVAINAPDTPFFTVGCEKSLNEHRGLFWKRGYVEFAFNYPQLVSDAGRYFPLFFYFGQARPVQEFLPKYPVQFCWELQGCRFSKVNTVGFTCAVWITAGDMPTAAECEAVWNEAVDHVAGFLSQFKFSNLPPSPPMYGAREN